MSNAVREAQLNDWAAAMLARHDVTVPGSFRLSRASDDASFRRYFRATVGDRSFIFVDAPPELEDSGPFVDIAGRLGAAGLNAPGVWEADLEAGFMMLSDLGDRLYLTEVTEHPEKLDPLYDDALQALVGMQKISVEGLPVYDEALLREEMSLFPDWFLGRQLGITLDQRERESLARVFRLMVDNARAQPRAFVHRDYHCRNLMVTETANPGIIDFQDAVDGPVTYDLVSLLRDCYIRFAPDYIDRRVEACRAALIEAGLLDGGVTPAQFRRWFDLMGLQRHLKCAGIFSRLHLRDGKARYLTDIPLVVNYIIEVGHAYDELAEFASWLEESIVPLLRSRLEFAVEA